jgi:F0F1-type ATP synthase assembly protein I
LAYATNLSFSLIAGSLVSYGVGYLASAYTLVVVLPILVLLAIAASLIVLAL